MGFLIRRRIEQVIAPLLIIRRVANRSVLRRNTIITGHFDPFHVGSLGGSLGRSGTSPGGNPASSADEDGESSGRLEMKIEKMEFRRGTV